MLPLHTAVRRTKNSKENSKNGHKEIISKRKDRKKKENNTSSEQQNKITSRNGGAKIKRKTVGSKEKTKGSKEQINEATTNNKTAGSKERNSYGYNKSSTTEAHSLSTSNDVYLFVEDEAMKKEIERRSFINTSVSLVLSIIFLIVGASLLSRYKHIKYKHEINFSDLLPSVTHYKLAILSDDFKTSHNIKTVLMDVGSNINYAREAAVYYTYKFKNDMYQNKTIVHPFSLQTSLLAWNFEFDPSAFSMQPVLVHQQTITETGPGGEAGKWTNGFDMGKSMMFSKLPKTSTSMFHRNINMLEAYDAAVGYYTSGLEDAYGNNKTTPSETTLFGSFRLMKDHYRTLLNYTFSEALPLVSLDSLYSMTTHDLGSLRFASSGPKTIGIIAEIAIIFALKTLRRYEKYTDEEVDNVIAESLACSLQALERYPGYFENLTLNIINLHKDVKNRTDNFRQNLNCLDKKQTVKVNTNGVSTSNVLFMYHGPYGWPTVMHYSVSTNESFHLESSNGKKSAGMLNVCQIVVMKDGALWLTAAASGEFYLVEKVVSSIVHKIVLNTDPLKLLNRDDRQRYDVSKAEILTGKYPPQKGLAKEVLQFCEYEILRNRFRSWVETSKGNSEEEKMNVASGY